MESTNDRTERKLCKVTNGASLDRRRLEEVSSRSPLSRRKGLSLQNPGSKENQLDDKKSKCGLFIKGIMKRASVVSSLKAIKVLSAKVNM